MLDDYLVVNTNIYNFLLGLDFLMKIKAVVDVEKGVIQVRSSPSIIVEVLFSNVVNMLQYVENRKEAYIDKFNNFNFEHLQGAKA